MKPTPVIAILDVGKTNKKLFLFNEKYEIVFEESIQLPQTIDEDGDPCEDLDLLTDWVKNSFIKLIALPQFQIKAINFTAYGASLVHLMKENQPRLPLYNYLKPYPENILQEFCAAYGTEEKLTLQTAAPLTGSLNSGLQLYRLKNCDPAKFEEIELSLHLPQYLSYIITGEYFSEMTSLGCHTALWEFTKSEYHPWVYENGIDKKLAPIKQSTTASKIIKNDMELLAGLGLHDSSAALIPYMKIFTKPFVLVSTGTWCISLNPFNHNPLTKEELQNDCLCYLSYDGCPVKASRLFSGYEHEQKVKSLSEFFSKPPDYFKTLKYDPFYQQAVKQDPGNVDLETFTTYEESYHHFMAGLIGKQHHSTKLILQETDVQCIYVDGGFSKNEVYMNLLAAAFPELEVYSAEVSQATALGAALILHEQWNSQTVPGNMIQLNHYQA